MLKFSSLAVVAVIGLSFGGSVSAQVYQRPQLNPYQRPTVSPYLNLLRGGNTAINYYGIVRPQQDFNRSIFQLQQVEMQQQQALLGAQAFVPVAQDPAQLLLPITGHPVSFFNYARYFPLATGGGIAQPLSTGVYGR